MGWLRFQTSLSFEEGVIVAKRVKHPVLTDQIARPTPTDIGLQEACRAHDGGPSSGTMPVAGAQPNVKALHGMLVNARLFADGMERAIWGSPHASAAQEAYAAAVRRFLDLSRAYLSVPGASAPGRARSSCRDRVGGLGIQHARLVFDRTPSFFPNFQKQR